MGNGLAGGSIVGAAEEDGLKRVGFLEGADDGSEGGGIPAFGGSVSGAWEDGEVGLGGASLGLERVGGGGSSALAEGSPRSWSRPIY